LIRSFRDKETATLYATGKSRRFQAVAERALNKLAMLHGANSLLDLKALRGNRPEPLKHDREGEFSIRINDQYRICFELRADGAYEVDVTDYHQPRKGNKR
jgi:proteic killer suppression protein